MNQAIYKEYRCPHDKKLLFKGLLISSSVEVKCRACKEIITVQGDEVDPYICKKIDCVNRVK